MARWKIAFLMAILLILLILFLPLGPIWFIAFLILFGIIIAIVVLRPKKTKENGSRVWNPAGQALHHVIEMSAISASASGPTPAGDARAHAVHASESSSSSSGIKYDLYLSFIDKDKDEDEDEDNDATKFVSRKDKDPTKFVSDLYTKLNEVGVRAFIDGEGLRKGEEIGWKLKEAIKQSRICIPILSQNFPSSKLCLDELVQMWECRESTGHIICPIFYYVSPSDVKFQSGDFGTSFSLHEKGRVNSKFIETWKKVLGDIGRIKGLVLMDPNKNKDKLVAEVVRVVQMLKYDEQVLPDKLVGIDHHVPKMMRKLGVTHIEGQATELSEDDVRIIGLWGMKGVGKTTLAKVIFNKTCKLFDACCFIEDIHLAEVSQEWLIGKLLKLRVPLELVDEEIKKFHNKKVLIVLDNVFGDEQIKAFTKELTWLGPGSRIIVTTRDKNVLPALRVGAFDHGTVEVYAVRPLSFDDALQLFRMHAFGENAPKDSADYDSLCKEIVKATEGLPSALENIGSTLYGEKREDIWKATLASLQEKTK